MSGLILDIPGTELRAEDIAIMQHPAVAGVILFTRNFESPEQLCQLTSAIRKAVDRNILITVDHEGGRVQRFRNGFTAIPAMAKIRKAAQSQAQATMLACELGWLMAKELLVCGVDHSFAPVLDVHGPSTVIGDRAFSDDADEIIVLAHGFIRGMHEAGMKATGKHFPGHGTVIADSHIDVPIDRRSFATIHANDGRVFAALAPHLHAIMPAHVIYPDVAPEPAGFSHYWLQTVLRADYQFEGLIISDDLLMAGAHVAGTVTERAEAALSAGCDLLLVCNDQQEAQRVLEHVRFPAPERDAFQYLGGTTETTGLAALRQTSRWQEAQIIVERIHRIAGAE